MAAADLHVLHVLPHPGGGGETYVRTLERLPDCRIDRVFVAPSPRVLSAVWPAVRSAVRIPGVATRYDLVHVHGEVAGGLCLPALARRPSVVTLHGLNAVRRFRGVRGQVARANLRAVVGRADRTICVSQAELDEVSGLDPRLADTCVVIPNGVDVPPQPTVEERRVARSALRVDEQSVLVLWVGALREPKQPQAAVRAVLEAARSGDPLQLMVLGDGPLRPAVEHEAVGHAAVRFLGHQDDVRPLLAAADAFVLVSAREGLPFALLEAMAAGLVPVVSAGPGVEEAVGKAGIAVAQGDGPGLAAALHTLATSADVRRRLGAAARARAAERFGMAAMLDSTRQVYDDVLARRGAAA